jgi:hypothetical protein
MLGTAAVMDVGQSCLGADDAIRRSAPGQLGKLLVILDPGAGARTEREGTADTSRNPSSPLFRRLPAGAADVPQAHGPLSDMAATADLGWPAEGSEAENC